jgi:hypothetical protein
MDAFSSGFKFPSLLPFRLDIGNFISLVQVHPGRQFCRWYKAFPQIPTNVTTQILPTDSKKFVRVEQEWPSPELRPMVVFDATGFNRTYREMLGMVDEGGMAMVYLPDEIEIAQDDWVTPWGMMGDGSDAPSRVVTEVVPRGRKRVTGVGTVSISGSTATFSSASHGARYGDVLVAAGRQVTLGTPTGVTVPILGTIVSSTTPVTNAKFELGRDALNHPGAYDLMEMMTASGTVLQGGLRVNIADNELVWVDIAGLTTATAISIRYRATPTYSVKSSWVRIPGFDYDSPTLPVGRLPHMAMGMQVIAETHRGWV